MSPSDVMTNDELELLWDMHNIPVPRELVRSVIYRDGNALYYSNHVHGKVPG